MYSTSTGLLVVMIHMISHDVNTKKMGKGSKYHTQQIASDVFQKYIYKSMSIYNIYILFLAALIF